MAVVIASIIIVWNRLPDGVALNQGALLLLLVPGLMLAERAVSPACGATSGQIVWDLVLVVGIYGWRRLNVEWRRDVPIEAA